MGTHSPEQLALLTDYATDSAYSTAYHTVCTNILLNWEGQQNKIQSVLLATPAPYPGHATAAANVAIAAAQMGTPTILIDADLRNPALQQRFGITTKTGLSNLLTTQTITPQTLSPLISNTFVSDLYLLGAGETRTQQHEISRLFTTSLQTILNSTHQFLQENQSGPGLIIFNSPPVLAGVDASLISAQVAQTFLVIASGRTTRTQARQAQEQLQRAHAQLTGMVLLDV